MSKSTQLTGADASPPTLAEASDIYGKLRVMRGTYVTDGTEVVGTEIEIARVSKGTRFIPIGVIEHGALGTSVTLSCGTSASPTLLKAATGAAAAGEIKLNDASGWGYKVTEDEASIILKVAGATLAAAITIDAFIIIAKE